MPDGIEQFGDLAAFVSHRDLPWHRLGTTTQDVLTAESVLELAHLSGWDVRKVPAYTDVPVGTNEDGTPKFEKLAMDGRFAVVRNNPFEPGKVDYLGDVGRQYDPVQNEEHVEFLNALAEHNEFETAGSIDDGRQVFVSMKKPEHLLVGGVDAVDMYLMAHNTHDGSKSFQVVTTPVRVVCRNTLSAALHGVGKAGSRRVAIRHTSGRGGAVSRAREALDLSFKYEETFEAEAEKMIQQTLTNAKFDKIVAQLFPIADDMSDLQKGRRQEVHAGLRSLYEASPTATEIRGTNWAGYQAVTEYMDYFANVPGKEGDAEQTRRAEMNLNGKTDEVKDQAFKLFQVA